RHDCSAPQHARGPFAVARFPRPRKVNYREALAWLYGTQTFGIKLGLENTRRLMAAAGNPQERLKFIHVAGTNGKGSVCAMLDAILREGGVRCGLFTSPHLIEFRERIRFDGVGIPESEAAEGLTLLREATAGWDHQPTFFEIAAALAAWWFDRAGAEIVVWETGMGGRLDATNVVTPLVSVITPIGLDHQKWLGSTIAEIAGEKAGIIKSGVPVVCATQREEALAVIRAAAKSQSSSFLEVTAPYAGPVGLPGVHQQWNAAVALAALDAANLIPDESACTRGLAAVRWPARFQRIGDNLVIDVAHNVSAAEALVATWREAFGQRKARLVFGALRDKNPADLLSVMRAIADEIVLVPVNSDRAAPTEDLRVAAESCGFTDIREGRLADVVRTDAPQPTLVAGSLFLAGEALALLESAPRPARSSQ
ncbi:MAG: bifunctional folylpolyglutamate synthase/dihydrofolate synthase, partial [Chthoniobacterales bacterium]